MLVRLQKYLADCGVASRRAAEKLILEGKVKVNNKVIKELGTKVNPQVDKVHCNNKLVKQPKQLVYLMLNKPTGYTTTISDPHQKQTVIKLLPKDLKVHPVGRLDKDSEGLLIFTNDGDLTQKLTHPKFEHQKEYLVKVDKVINSKAIKLFLKGVKLQEGLAKADEIKRVPGCQFQIIIHQGRKRQIRRMCEVAGYQVKSLKRIRVGKLKLGSLPLGEFKYIKKEDIV